MKKIKINKERAFKVFDILINVYRKRLIPFDAIERPQDSQFLPKNLVFGSREHALYLFFICLYMRGRIKSQQAFEAFKNLYTHHPELFNPKIIQSNPAYYHKKLQEQLKKGRLGFAVTDNAKFWIKNSGELYTYWNGDPRNLFKCLNNNNRETSKAYKLICQNIIRRKVEKNQNMLAFYDTTTYQGFRGFYGFQHKMVSMLSYFYDDAGIIPSFLYPSPIDYHVSRLLIMQGIIKVRGIKNGIQVSTILPAARKITFDYCSKQNVKAVELSDVLWLYSQLMCNKSPDASRFSKLQEIGRKSKIIIAKTIKWNKKNMDNYFDSCHLCVINTSCEGYISQIPYYTNSELKLVAKLTPPQIPLFPFCKRKSNKKPKSKVLKSNSPTLRLSEASLFDIST